MRDKKRRASSQSLERNTFTTQEMPSEKTINRVLCVLRWKAYIALALSPTVVSLDSCADKSIKWMAVYSGNNSTDLTCNYGVVYYYFVFVNTIRLFADLIKYICNITLFAGKLWSISDGTTFVVMSKLFARNQVRHQVDNAFTAICCGQFSLLEKRNYGLISAFN